MLSSKVATRKVKRKLDQKNMPDTNSVVAALVRARSEKRLADDKTLAQALQSTEHAYSVQSAVARHHGWYLDAPPRYWKSGGANRQAELTHAPLPPVGVCESPANCGDWPFAMRGIEAEIALRLGKPVDAALADTLVPEDAVHLVDCMAVSIEIVDSRWQQGMAAPALLKLADLSSHGALVLGNWVAYQALDWSRQVCRVCVGEQPEVKRVGTHPLGDPAWLLPQWLRHACANSGPLPAGTVVTTGTWVGVLLGQKGDHVKVVFDGLGEASVSL